MKNIYNKEKIYPLINKLKDIQHIFLKEYGVNDIFSNSKFYEIIIANQLNHTPIPGHSGSRDARDPITNQEYEYKHFKETSSNHSWTFNDYSDNTIEHLKSCTVVFAHINDQDFKYPGLMDWFFEIPGAEISDYLKEATKEIKNTRKMINVSPSQLSRLGYTPQFVDTDEHLNYQGNFQHLLYGISSISEELENITDIEKILTSNKIWELLVALELNHKVNAEQGGRLGSYDAIDLSENTFEYKVYKTRNWNFQDISENVLNKYLTDKAMILAVVNKYEMKVEEIYSVSPEDAVTRLKEKLNKKIGSLKKQGKEIRRLQINLTFSDIKSMKSFKRIY